MRYPTTDRIVYFDVLRAVSCLAVIMIHISATFVYRPVESVDFWIGNVLDSLSRFSVPVFVMLSGALLLDEQYVFSKKKMIGHIRKMMIFFVFWSVVYGGWYAIRTVFVNGEAVRIKDLVIMMIEGHKHLWYVYMIVGLYLIVPLLKLFVNKANKRYAEYFLFLAVVTVFTVDYLVRIAVQIMPTLRVFNTVLDYLNLRFVGGYTAYFLLGWYLHNFEITRKKRLYAAGIGAVLFMIAATPIIAQFSAERALAYENLGFPNLLASAALFVGDKVALLYPQNRTAPLRHDSGQHRVSLQLGNLRCPSAVC